MEDFITYCKQYIYDHIDDYRGQHIYLCDLGWTITEGPNMDGSLTYSRADAMDYLREWWAESADYFDYEKSQFGDHLHNPFDNPEAYMVCMVIEGVRQLIDDAIWKLGLEDEWNEMVELTGDIIEKICEKVNENETNKLF